MIFQNLDITSTITACQTRVNTEGNYFLIAKNHSGETSINRRMELAKIIRTPMKTG
jgi:hypothetical protein